MEYLQKTVDSVIAVVPKVLLFLLIPVVGWIVARLLLNVLARVLNRVGFDRAVERGGIRRWLGDNQASQLAAKLVYYAILLIALQMAFGVFGPNPVSRVLSSIIGFLPLAFVAVVIIVISAAIAGAVKDVVGAGGGLIEPMRHRWERWLAHGEAELHVARSHLAWRPDRTRQMPTTAGTPQPAYTSQGSGAAVDPAHPREAQPGTTPPGVRGSAGG